MPAKTRPEPPETRRLRDDVRLLVMFIGLNHTPRAGRRKRGGIFVACPHLVFFVGSLELGVWPRAAASRHRNRLLETRGACGGPNSKRKTPNAEHKNQDTAGRWGTRRSALALPQRHAIFPR